MEAAGDWTPPRMPWRRAPNLLGMACRKIGLARSGTCPARMPCTLCNRARWWQVYTALPGISCNCARHCQKSTRRPHCTGQRPPSAACCVPGTRQNNDQGCIIQRSCSHCRHSTSQSSWRRQMDTAGQAFRPQPPTRPPHVHQLPPQARAMPPRCSLRGRFRADRLCCPVSAAAARRRVLRCRAARAPSSLSVSKPEVHQTQGSRCGA